VIEDCGGDHLQVSETDTERGKGTPDCIQVEVAEADALD
jgi:hypothetical protein